MKKIDRKILEQLPVPLPSLEEQRVIVRASNELAERINREQDWLKQLVQAKTALSQGLLTGRIPVKAADSGEVRKQR